MKNSIHFFKQVGLVLYILFLVLGSSISKAEESAENGLQRCAMTNNSSARLACYDLLSGRENKAIPNIVETPILPLKELDSTPVIPAKNLDTKPLIMANVTKTEPETANLKIVNCTRSGGNDKYTFYLDDGQVWKQVSHTRMNFEDCNVVVSIHKDFFGYKMQVEGTQKKFRVARVR